MLVTSITEDGIIYCRNTHSWQAGSHHGMTWHVRWHALQPATVLCRMQHTSLVTLTADLLAQQHAGCTQRTHAITE
jgi:hypothetical protein